MTRSGQTVDLAREFEAAGAEARGLFERLGEAAARFRPFPAAWSMAECLDHLNVAGRLYLAAIDRAIEDGRKRGLTGYRPYQPGFVERWIVRSLDAPPLFRTKSPPSFRPSEDAAPIAHSLHLFLLLQADLVERVRRAEGVDLARVKVTSPASALVRLSLGGAFAATAAHQRRHLWQARQLREAPGFPA
jgi:hypothetical protein